MANVNGQNSELVNKMQTGAGAENTPVESRPKAIFNMLEKMKTEIAKALPKHITPERMARLCYTEIRKNPKLMECTADSLMGAVMLMSQFGLEPGPMGRVWLIPRNNRKENKLEVEFQIGYKGLLELMRRSGDFAVLTAKEVYANDEFVSEYGYEQKCLLKPAKGDRGKLVGFVAYYTLTNGGQDHVYMTVEEMDLYAKTHSESYNSDYSPWKKHYEAMGKKTVLKQLSKYAPMSVEYQYLLEADEKPVDKDSIDVDYEIKDTFNNEQAS